MVTFPVIAVRQSPQISLHRLANHQSGYPEARHNAVIDPTSSWDAVAAFKPAIQAAKAGGSIVLGQLTHAGRVSCLIEKNQLLLTFSDMLSKHPTPSPRSLSPLRTFKAVP